MFTNWYIQAWSWLSEPKSVIWVNLVNLPKVKKIHAIRAVFELIFSLLYLSYIFLWVPKHME